MRKEIGAAALAVGGIGFLLRKPIEEKVGDFVTVKFSEAFTVWDEMLHKYSGLRQVPWRWLKAIMWIESDLGRDQSVLNGIDNPGGDDGWSADGKSRGLMQLTLATANRARVRPGTSTKDLDDPEISIDCAARYMRELSIHYFPKDREGVIRGYNGGPGWKQSGAVAQAMTANYYSRFVDKLTQIMEAQPGNEMEIG